MVLYGEDSQKVSMSLGRVGRYKCLQHCADMRKPMLLWSNLYNALGWIIEIDVA